jgi:hypothetical protein
LSFFKSMSEEGKKSLFWAERAMRLLIGFARQRPGKLQWTGFILNKV